VSAATHAAQHAEAVTPFARQLQWTPGPDDAGLVAADRMFIEHGYLPPRRSLTTCVG
jgi:hypothetical protein